MDNHNTHQVLARSVVVCFGVVVCRVQIELNCLLFVCVDLDASAYAHYVFNTFDHDHNGSISFEVRLGVMSECVCRLLPQRKLLSENGRGDRERARARAYAEKKKKRKK